MSDHLPPEVLRERLAGAKRLVEVGARYEHYKGTQYLVTDIVILEATREPAVVYLPDTMDDIPFVRPLASFLEMVDGQPRFKKL